MFVMTRQWVKANGPWTAAKFEVVGYSWPPPAGWVDLLVNELIDDEQKAKVEQLHVEQMAKKAARAKRHERMQEGVYYTWPDGNGSFNGSASKPDWWDTDSSPGFKKLQRQQGTSLQTKRDGSASKI